MNKLCAFHLLSKNKEGYSWKPLLDFNCLRYKFMTRFWGRKTKLMSFQGTRGGFIREHWGHFRGFNTRYRRHKSSTSWFPCNEQQLEKYKPIIHFDVLSSKKWFLPSSTDMEFIYGIKVLIIACFYHWRCLHSMDTTIFTSANHIAGIKDRHNDVNEWLFYVHNSAQ